VNRFDTLFAATYDLLMRVAERGRLGEQRSRLLAPVGGQVAEIGAGTGANLPHYGPTTERLILLEPSPAMAARLRRRVARDPRAGSTSVVEAPAEALPLPDDSVDVVVSTLVLCTVADLDRSLVEICRVLRPGGRLVLLEHVAGHGATAVFQRLLDPVWHRVGRGCHLTRDTRARLVTAGFDLRGVTAWHLPGAGPAAPAITGVALAP